MKYIITSNENDVSWGATDDERIIQNARNIIRTRKFEVPFMRGMGISQRYFDNSLNELKAYLFTDISENLKEYEDRVTVTSVDIISVDENGDYVISVELEV